MRRVAPSPASTRYGVPLTTSRFDDCVRPGRGSGPPLVPRVMSTVPFAACFACVAGVCDSAGMDDAISAATATPASLFISPPRVLRRTVLVRTKTHTVRALFATDAHGQRAGSANLLRLTPNKKKHAGVFRPPVLAIAGEPACRRATP